MITHITHQPPTLLLKITNSFSFFSFAHSSFRGKKKMWPTKARREGEGKRKNPTNYWQHCFLKSVFLSYAEWALQDSNKATSLLNLQLILPHVPNYRSCTYRSSSTYARPVCTSSAVLIIFCFIFVMGNCPIQQMYDTSRHQALPNADKQN